MNKTHFILIVVLLAVASNLISGCGGPRHYDSRLLVADSLLTQDADSALRFLSTIDRKSLPSQSDHALYALLLTQARYRCYVPATSDSDINLALNHYRHHPDEVEKLTRCHIYKGAVMEELGQYDSSMTSYKCAMTVVSDDDHFNQGYIRLRMGHLYRDWLVSDNSDIDLFKQALSQFKMVPDSFYILTCLSDIGGSFIKSDNDSAVAYLEEAKTLATALHERAIEQKTMIYLADIKMYSPVPQDIETAKQIALSLLNAPDSPESRHDHLLMIAALTLAKQNKADSARLYLKQVNTGKLSEGLKVFHLKCQAELARCRGDIGDYQYYYERYDHLSDSLSNNDYQLRLREVETQFDTEKLKYENAQYHSQLVRSVLAGLLAVSLLTILLMVMRQRAARRKRQILESEETIHRLHDDISQLEIQLNSHQTMNEELKHTLKHQIGAFSKLIESHSHLYTDNPKQFLQVFKQTYRLDHPEGSFWEGIQAYADSQYGNIISRIGKENPSLKLSDLNFLSLYSIGLSSTVIMACMGYHEQHSIYNKKRRILEKLGFDGTLEEFLRKYNINT